MADPFSLSAGILVGGDIVSLPPSLRLEKLLLIDTANGARHQLHAQAAKALAPLRRPIAVDEWMAQMDTLGITAMQAGEIIMFLNSIGGLHIQRTPRSWRVIARRLQFKMHNIPLDNPSRRTPATTIGVTHVIMRAMSPFVLLVLVLAALLLAIGISASTVLLICGLSSFTLLASTMAHELAHASILAPQARQSAVMLQRGMRLGLLHTKMGLKRELTSALLGPMVGCISVMVICGGAWLLTKQDVCLTVGVLACIAHIFSLLPFYGDGKTIRDYIKDTQYEKTI